MFGPALRLLPHLLRGTALGRMQGPFYAALNAALGAAGPAAPLFLNFGLAPADPGLAEAPEPFQATLAAEVLRAGRAALGRDPARMLDAACGRGGTARLAAALFPGAVLLGSDLQPAALVAARAAAPGLLPLAADGLRLPLAGGAVDLLVSVEAMMNLGRRAFLAEAARVLAPGGVLAATGSYAGPPSMLNRLLHQEAAAAGLLPWRLRDLTQGVVAACRADAPRRRALLARAPLPLRRRLADFAALPGTPTFAAYAGGARCYYLAVLRRS